MPRPFDRCDDVELARLDRQRQDTLAHSTAGANDYQFNSHFA
jgi:hypothetical protein